MRLEHIALWTRNLEPMKAFYEKFFSGTAGAKYVNQKKHFESYFITFAAGARLEIMQRPDVCPAKDASEHNVTGYIHIAFSAGSRQEVDALTERLREHGFSIVSEPRVTGDGYYESVILDPDGNEVEITE